MADIFRFQPSDMGPAPTTQGNDVATSFWNSFYAARQDARAEQGMANETARLGIQQEQHQATMEDRAWENEFLRPIELQSKQLGISSQVLGLESQKQGLTLQNMKMGAAMQRKNLLNGILNDMTNYANDGSNAVGKVTSYGYASDQYGDSASLGTGSYKQPTGAWNNALSKESLAVSPDIEKQFKQMGIKQGQKVRLKLADGSEVIRQWDDRTMQDEQAIKKFGKPLTGRFDFYNAEGPDARDGQSVVGFSPVGGDPTSLTNVSTGGVAPVGGPVYAQVAASATPMATVNQSFTPNQQKWLSHYDTLQMVAQEGQGTEDGQMAGIMLQQLERNPDFQAALGQRQLILEAARNQAGITQQIMAAPAQFVDSFQSMYGQYALQPLPNGQVVPFNRLTQQPLNPQEQMAFASAWTEHRKYWKPSSDTALGDTLVKDYNSAWGRFEGGREFLDTPDDDLSEEQLRLKRAARSAMGTVQSYEAQFPGKFGNYRSYEANRIAAEEAERLRLEQEKAKPGAGGSGPAAKSITSSSQRGAGTEVAALWTEQKGNLDKRLTLDFPDSGSDNPDENAALAFAMDVYKGESPTVRDALAVYGEDRMPEAKGVDPNARMSTDTVGNLALVRLGLHSQTEAFKQPGRWGSNTVKYGELLKAWAQDKLRQYGYLDENNRPISAQQKTELTPEQKALADKLLK